jgi:hypothetical protein
MQDHFRQPRYSDLAIELCLTLGMVFKQPLRQTQGFMRSIAALLGVEIAVPDFSTLSRRGNGLILHTRQRSDRQAVIHLVVDSTGPKIFGEGEWLEEKHKTKRKRRPCCRDRPSAGIEGVRSFQDAINAAQVQRCSS